MTWSVSERGIVRIVILFWQQASSDTSGEEEEGKQYEESLPGSIVDLVPHLIIEQVDLLDSLPSQYCESSLPHLPCTASSGVLSALSLQSRALCVARRGPILTPFCLRAVRM